MFGGICMNFVKFIFFNIYTYIISIIITLINIPILQFFHIKNIVFGIVLYYVCLQLFIHIYEGYKLGRYKVSEIVYSVSISVLICNVMMYFVVYLVTGHWFVLLIALLLQCLHTLLIIIWAVRGNIYYFKLYEHHKILLVYGSDPTLVAKKIEARKNRYFIAKTMSDKEDLETIKKELDHYKSIMVYDVKNEVKDMISIYCFEKGKSFFIIPDIAEIIRRGTRNLYLMDTPLMMTNHWGLTPGQCVIKRIMDLVIIIPVAIIASPFMLITAMCIKLYDGGPVIYKQKRLTQAGKIFEVYKFRSMIVDAEKHGAQLSTTKDSRITPVGKVIRAIRFDELPQIINILKGEMSNVGPRPERPEIAEEYYKDFPEFKLRLRVKAGLTGYAQVFGKYNTTPEDKLKLDLMYINDYSIFLNLKLIIYTVKILFMKDSTEGIEEGKTTAGKK